MNNTSFNIAGFIQPYYVVELLHRDDHDGFSDRQLFDVPPGIEVNYRDLETELPTQIPSFKYVFQYVIDLHESPKTYSFGEDAMKSFIEYHDALNERKSATIDNDIRGVLSKAKGQSTRLATILYIADHCIKDVRANCFCASLLRTKFTCHVIHWARALSSKVNNNRANGHSCNFAWI